MTIAPRRPLPTMALRGAAPVGVADGGVVGAAVEVGGVMLVSRVVDGASVVLAASVVDSAVVLAASVVEVVDGAALVEVDEALVEEVVVGSAAVEIWETLMVVVDFPSVDSAVEMLMVPSPAPAVEPPSPPEMVNGLEYWN